MLNEMSGQPFEPSFIEHDIIDTNPVVNANLRATRWLVFAGDRLPPSAKRTFDGMRLGGEVLGSDFKTLAPTRGLLRRCELTPMVLGHDDFNEDLLGGDLSKARSRAVYNEAARQNENIYFNECLPGHEIEGLFQSCQGVFDYGIREVKSLFGAEVSKDCPAFRFQREIFPDWDDYLAGRKPFLATTEELRDYLNGRLETAESEIARDIIRTMLESNDQFERWGTMQLDHQSRLVKAPPTEGGRIYGWEPLHVQLFEMLKLNREEFLMKKTDAPPVRDNSANAEEMELMREQIRALTAATTALVQLQQAGAIAASSPLPPINHAAPPSAASPSENKPEKSLCAGTKPKGGPCRLPTVAGSAYCEAHQPKE